MSIRNFEHLLAPRSVALIGASDVPHSIGAITARNLKRGGFKGPLWFVNPRRPVVEGVACYASVDALPDAPDLAVIATPAATIPGLIDELGRKGCRAAVIITAGVRGELADAMLAAAGRHLLRIQGPNCIGLMVPGIGLDASFSHRAARNGRLAFLSQSGALVTAIVDWAESRGIGFSHVVSLGDMADADFGDFLDYFAGDPSSRAILLYMESLKHAPKFMSAARRAARSKPVIVIKSGRHEASAKAAFSHTGALAGADAAYDAAFRRAGLLRVQELSELFDAAEILSKVSPLEGERLTIVTNGGGAGVLAADALSDHGGLLGSLAPETLAKLDGALPATWSHSNPVDIIGDAGPDRYAAALDAVLDDPQTDAVLVINCPTALHDSHEAAEAVTRTLAARRAAKRRSKPVLTNWLGVDAAESSRRHFAEHHIASFDTPADSVHGFMQLVRYTRAQTELLSMPPSLPEAMYAGSDATGQLIADCLAQGRRHLTELEAKNVLSAFGIPTVATELAATPAEARDRAAPMLARHGAVVIKILSVDIPHKSDVGGVRLNLETPLQVEQAAELMLERARAARPDARIDGFTVQPMIRRSHAHELIVGVSEDPTFGPLLMFGAGGTAVEVLRDAAYALPPLDLRLAHDLIRQTRVSRLLAGYRDRAPANIEAIAMTLVKLGYMVASHPAIREIDINPLLADETDAIVLDARIRLEDPVEKPRVRMAIRPYPREWQKEVDFDCVGHVTIRPIRPEDEALYQEFFSHVDAEDMRLRFFTPRPDLSHKFLARLTQIDYAREMAFVALSKDGDLLGVARFIADADFVRGEYGVLVRSDLKGHGLGWKLMQHLIDYARSTGLHQIIGAVLADNTTMLKMCESLGFKIQPFPGDPSVREVVLDLATP
ncbi:MAG: GNAT family N-acetyltransferase [Hyphomicrobiaceae bacterium]